MEVLKAQVNKTLTIVNMSIQFHKQHIHYGMHKHRLYTSQLNAKDSLKLKGWTTLASKYSTCKLSVRGGGAKYSIKMHD